MDNKRKYLLIKINKNIDLLLHSNQVLSLDEIKDIENNIDLLYYDYLLLKMGKELHTEYTIRN